MNFARSRPFSLRFVAVVAAAGHILSLTAADQPKREGEKIDFSAPTESTPVKPLTERDLGPRPFSFQRDDLNAQGQLGSPMSSLPAPDQVNRARALQELIERSALLYTSDGDGMGLEDDPLRPTSADEDLGIDELYSGGNRAGGPGRERSALGRDSETGDESGRDRNPGDRERDRDRDRDRDRLGMRLDDRRGVTGVDNEDSGLFSANGSSGRDGEDRFMPTFDLRPRDDSERGQFGNSTERGRDREGNREGARSMFGSRDGSETRRETDGIASFRKMLSTAGRGDASSAAGGRSGAGTVGGGGFLGTFGGSGNNAAGTGSPLFGATPGANRSLSEALDARGGAATPTGEALDGARSPALPSRPVDLGLNIGRETGQRRTEVGRTEFVPPPRAMELFQKKHDTRLPSRAF